MKALTLTDYVDKRLKTCKQMNHVVQFEYVQLIVSSSMPQIPVETNDRMSLRIASNEKALLIRAATLQHINLTDFVIRNVVSAAKKVIDENEHLTLSERDSLRVLDLLDNPPEPNEKLLAAALALSK
jgi:uncharacterized protein (DUF1778 family)